jgi:hypothetical protein
MQRRSLFHTVRSREKFLRCNDFRVVLFKVSSPANLAKSQANPFIRFVAQSLSHAAFQDPPLSSEIPFKLPKSRSPVIRPIAISLGYLDTDVEITCGCGPGHHRMRIVAQGGAGANQCEGVQSAADDDGFVKATKRLAAQNYARIPFPEDGPQSKYSALFDSRSMFDGLRENFMTWADPASKPMRFLDQLRLQASSLANDRFQSKVDAWAMATDPDAMPEDFGRRAWGAYLHCVQNRSYYFSPEELVAICRQAQVSVAVFEQAGEAWKLLHGSFSGRGPLVCTMLKEIMSLISWES